MGSRGAETSAPRKTENPSRLPPGEKATATVTANTSFPSIYLVSIPDPCWTAAARVPGRHFQTNRCNSQNLSLTTGPARGQTPAPGGDERSLSGLTPRGLLHRVPGQMLGHQEHPSTPEMSQVCDNLTQGETHTCPRPIMDLDAFLEKTVLVGEPPSSLCPDLMNS